MDKIVVHGGRRLIGSVDVAGAKNAALPILFASLLTPDTCVLRRLPNVVDVRTSLRLLAGLGATVSTMEDGSVSIAATDLGEPEAKYELVKTMRASFLVLGPLLARCGRARVSTPGGCAIGGRPVDIHLNGLRKMGAEIEVVHGYAEARAPRLHGAQIHLDMASVGATQHLMMTAALAEGETVLENAACEPEVADLGRALVSMGADIEGAGESVVRIRGSRLLHGTDFSIIADRIEAGTFMIAAAITGGDVTIRGARAEHLQAFIGKLRETGVQIDDDGASIRVCARGRLRGTDVKTLPYPGFATDLQAQFMALATISEGTSVIAETIFENRFMHAQELMRMGADIKLEGNSAIVRGVEQLSGAPVMATDLRASVSLILAALAAENTTEVLRVYHLDRGYERIEEKLSGLGADIERVRGARG